MWWLEKVKVKFEEKLLDVWVEGWGLPTYLLPLGKLRLGGGGGGAPIYRPGKVTGPYLKEFEIAQPLRWCNSTTAPT